jgi:ATP-dependent DNA ligase
MMDLPVRPPVKPMLAKSVGIVPDGMLYEPKWDGFRCVVFRDGDEVELGSRNERPLTRYFPEVVEAVKAQLPSRCVVDGEIVIVRDAALDFDALLNRIHPAASRIALLAADTPASFIAFDLLALGDEDLTALPFATRRERLEAALAGAGPPVHITPLTGSTKLAGKWFRTFEGAGLDGVVAKPADQPYLQDKRVMFKVKHERTADCVVAGFRWHKSSKSSVTADSDPGAPAVGSLLLGLYDEDGSLQHVGVSASFPMARRRTLVDELAPYRLADGEHHPWLGENLTPERIPGGVTRWNAKKDLAWQPLRPELVVEVAYDHMEGTRFRHTAQFRRWRPDRDPVSCTYEQLDHPVLFDLADILGGGSGVAEPAT